MQPIADPYLKNYFSKIAYSVYNGPKFIVVSIDFFSPSNMLGSHNDIYESELQAQLIHT